MSTTTTQLDDKPISFIKQQKMFFVATAPLSGNGHVNVSPKGYDAFRVISPNQVAYADLGGSGIETVAHARKRADHDHVLRHGRPCPHPAPLRTGAGDAIRRTGFRCAA
ncbi:MAG: hypothetical protein SGJ03_17540 [Alphaproteobacteria bacterium]|nr:hypothetical protein [Alphaproteobacteria bacterium]